MISLISDFASLFLTSMMVDAIVNDALAIAIDQYNLATFKPLTEMLGKGSYLFAAMFISTTTTTTTTTLSSW
jgi:hypothetical protein